MIRSNLSAVAPGDRSDASSEYCRRKVGASLQDLFVVWLRNAHAVERQPLSITTPQVEHIVNHPEVAEQLRLHIDETQGRISRIDELSAGLDPSAVMRSG